MTRRSTSRSKSPGRPAARLGGSRQVARFLPALARKAYRKYGFTESSVITRWPEIVGAQLAARTAPAKVAFPQGRRHGGTLHIIAEAGGAVELQHLESLVTERINGFYGYAAIARIAITQAPVAAVRRTRRRAPVIVDRQTEKKLHKQLDGIADESLKSALSRLGLGVLSDAPEKTP